MLIDNIPEKELNIIEKYIRSYCDNSDGAELSYENCASIEDILTPWSCAKEERLFSLLGDQLILTKRVEYDRTIEELVEDFRALSVDDFNIIYDFKQEFLKIIKKNSEYYEYFDYFLDMCSYSSLAANKYSGPNFVIKIPGTGPYRVATGMKITRFLGKMAKVYNIKGFEEFRLLHSQILNQKKFTGDLCLSIHPLDYITMSDNNSGWDSCMSWKEYGDYRQGTVEMMNSPTVLVAYLKSNKDMTIIESENLYWNNKKWRELFVVDDALSIGVKGYPYHSDFLETTVLDWIKELAKNNLNINYNNDFIEYNDGKIPLKDKDGTIYQKPLYFNNNHMYSDFGYTINKKHRCRINPFYMENIDIKSKEHLRIKYSGNCECMWCGSTMNGIEESSSLVCDVCDDRSCCEFCGERTYDNLFTIDGYKICEYCYNEYVIKDIITEEEHIDREMETSIYVIPDGTVVKDKTDIIYNSKTIIKLYENLTYYTDEEYKLLFFNGKKAIHTYIKEINSLYGGIFSNKYYYVYRSELTEYVEEEYGLDPIDSN